MKSIFLLLAFSIACAPMAATHQADAAFRKALTAQLAGDMPQAEVEYRRVLELGIEDAPTLNNLAVISVRRHQYIAARHLLARAMHADSYDVVALTNYGVMSFYLADLDEARRTLSDARTLRRTLMQQIPSTGRTNWDQERYARGTETLDEVAARYLERIAQAETAGAAQMLPDELTAALTVSQPRKRM
jgi:Tfp pilus assembly protein PilF